MSVDLPDVMRVAFHMTPEAIANAFAHGLVFVDGRCLGNTERVLPLDEVRGRTLRIGRLSRNFNTGGVIVDARPESLF